MIDLRRKTLARTLVYPLPPRSGGAAAVEPAAKPAPSRSPKGTAAGRKKAASARAKR